ncbi:hypothetical protein AX17_001404 [Amanita inopinata Kibby_2008]|nr:hypothetical protein AX17_001404 [Amanita inopinata Kibby_2008]
MQTQFPWNPTYSSHSPTPYYTIDRRQYEPYPKALAILQPTHHAVMNPAIVYHRDILLYDVRKHPKEAILAGTYQSVGHTPIQLQTSKVPTRMRLISDSFPWDIEIRSSQPLTCRHVWWALYNGLQFPIETSEWAFIMRNEKWREKAFRKRMKNGDRKSDKMRRIDFLGNETLFAGLEKDRELVSSRSLPGMWDMPETWVAKFAKPDRRRGRRVRWAIAD